MNQEPYKVSLLVPIYGVEDYIERCAKSLFEQTYKNIEYVFVNDCTKDKSVAVLLETIKRYPHIDKKIKLYNNKKNSGIATTRNALLKYCTGDFFAFVDSDDWIEYDFVEKMVECQDVNKSDIVTCNYMIYEDKGMTFFSEPKKEKAKDMLTDLINGRGSGRLWGRLIRTSLVKDNNIHFIDGANFAEDVMMLSYLWYFCKDHSMVGLALYNYERRNLSSYSNSFNYINSIQSLCNLDGTRCFFKKYAPEYLDAIDYQELNKVVGHMCLCVGEKKNKDYYNNELLRRLDIIDKRYRRQLPLSLLIPIYLRYFELVRIYVLIGKTIKRIVG